MSTDLTTTIILREPLEGPPFSFRFIRTADGSLRINALSGDSAVFSEEDAIMPRDWLNDEWPAKKRDDYGMTATEAMAKAMGTNLWGRDRYDEGPEYPIKGCDCPGCEKARGR